MLVAVIIKVVADIYGKYLVYMASDALLPCRYQSLSAAIDLLKIRQSVQDISCDTVSVAFRHKTQLPDKVSMKIKAMQEQKTHRHLHMYAIRIHLRKMKCMYTVTDAVKPQ